jgi:allophanate hydrolase subunit 2
MTNVSGVRMVYVQPQERKENVASAHVKNAVVTAAGLGGTYGLVRMGLESGDKLLANDIITGKKYIDPAQAPKLNNVSKFATRIHRGFQKLGEKMFKTGADEEIISKLYKLSQNSENYATKLKSAKGHLAMGMAAIATILAFATRFVYQAGKINGQAQ